MQLLLESLVVEADSEGVVVRILLLCLLLLLLMLLDVLQVVLQEQRLTLHSFLLLRLRAARRLFDVLVLLNLDLLDHFVSETNSSRLP